MRRRSGWQTKSSGCRGGVSAHLNDWAVLRELLMLAVSPEPLNSAGYGRRRPIAAARIYSPAKTTAAILRTRSGSAIASISTILPPATVKPITVMGRSPNVTTTPAAPFTRAGRR